MDGHQEPLSLSRIKSALAGRLRSIRMEIYGEQGGPGVMKSWSCTSCAFIPISLRGFFPTLTKGGSGGVRIIHGRDLQLFRL